MYISSTRTLGKYYFSIIPKYRQVFLLELIATKINYLIAHKYKISDVGWNARSIMLRDKILRYLYSEKALWCEETMLQNS